MHTRAERACPTSIPTSPRCSWICLAPRGRSRGRKAKPHFCSRAKAAGQSCRICMRATGQPRPQHLIAALKRLEHASAVLVGDSGMQVTALAFDVLMTPGSHAVLMRQVYNKTRSYLAWLADRVGGRVTIVDDGDHEGLAAAITPETRFVFAETFTNPLVRAQDLDRAASGRHGAPRSRSRRCGW